MVSPFNVSHKTFRITRSNIAVFWVLMTGLAAVGLAWMNTLATNTGSQVLANTSNMFLILFFISIIVEFTVYLFFDQHQFWGNARNRFGAFGTSMLWFYVALIGTVLFYGSSQFSVLDPMVLLSQAEAAGALTEFQGLYMNLFVAPIIEENFFRIALPVLILIMLVGLANSTFLSFLDNPGVQIFVAIVLSSAGFVVFHTQQVANNQFTVAAFMFGVILSTLFLLDLYFNILPSLSILPAALVGTHMGNNLSFIGLERAATILTCGSTGPGVGTLCSPVTGNLFGWIIITVFALGFVAAVSTLFDYVTGG